MGKVVLTEKAVYVENVLKNYKADSISLSEKEKLLAALQKYYLSLKTDRDKEYFEILINRYIIKEPLSLSELSDIYNSNKNNIKSWEINKGIITLSQFYEV